MGSEDWYRNTQWNDEIEGQFMAKLRRARIKEQYLRIQASILAEIEPNVAITLLEKYFSLEDNFDYAQAYCDYAKAFLSLGEIQKALDSYTSALKREAEFPKLLTDAYILYPLTIVQHEIEELYTSANNVLEKNHHRLMFPVDHFKWHASKALIEHKAGNKVEASSHAEQALIAAKIETSGLSFHKKLGLVGKEYENMVNDLRAI